ncbi:hypothetical protein K435DRAFT_913700 [Dendrothele bispora CBS 962.96]|uniref:Uncharacterized protein n=1 Tax=Dendrothele bispora (strain CBS 962.96) TaxID=1314807 RepID=A0A4S8KIZ0_DENBC|nr:hypothetical protein K435DRAFT_913700 [Dendrothele bispora CBS 962.96]
MFLGCDTSVTVLMMIGLSQSVGKYRVRGRTSARSGRVQRRSRVSLPRLKYGSNSSPKYIIREHRYQPSLHLVNPRIQLFQLIHVFSKLPILVPHHNSLQVINVFINVALEMLNDMVIRPNFRAVAWDRNMSNSIETSRTTYWDQRGDGEYRFERITKSLQAEDARM